MYRINIYQINMELDIAQVCFMDLDWTLKHCDGRVPSEAYVCIYTEETEEKPCLEYLFKRFNDPAKPDSYHGRSMSVSDVVEVISGTGTKAYYCRSIGFEEIEFDSSLCAEQKAYCKNVMGRTIYVR